MGITEEQAAFYAKNTADANERLVPRMTQELRANQGKPYVTPSTLKIIASRISSVRNDLAHARAELSSTADAIFGTKVEPEGKDEDPDNPGPGIIGQVMHQLLLLERDVEDLRRQAVRLGTL